MEGMIVNFRRSRHRTYGNQMIIMVDGTDNKEKAAKLVGKSVSWTAPGKEKKEIKGKISAAHGNKGILRVLFEKGMPGQSIGAKVNIS
ncbi:50S ribosomal protein L35ae [Candidatus Woesearchaeota archaeon]|nr:50S ribosomal protein L35ae [Candidatus Woesearchaeota archaeon]